MVNVEMEPPALGIKNYLPMAHHRLRRYSSNTFRRMFSSSEAVASSALALVVVAGKTAHPPTNKQAQFFYMQSMYPWPQDMVYMVLWHSLPQGVLPIHFLVASFLIHFAALHTMDKFEVLDCAVRVSKCVDWQSHRLLQVQSNVCLNRLPSSHLQHGWLTPQLLG